MSYYVSYYNANRKLYKTLAECWVERANSSCLSQAERDSVTKFFRKKATRFGLVQDFRRIGVLT